MCIYENVKLVSTLIKLINTKKSNVIISAIYRHPSIELNDFNDNYLNPLLDKISKERKSIFLFGDFSVNLLKYDCHALTNKFFDYLSCHMLLPKIMQPTRVTSNSKALIDNIFSNTLSPDSVSGSLTATVSDHLPQFVVAANNFSCSPSGRKSKIYEKDWTLIKQVLFLTI